RQLEYSAPSDVRPPQARRRWRGRPRSLDRNGMRELLVVPRPSRRITEYLVGTGSGGEPLGPARILVEVGVMLAGNTPVGAADVRRGRIARNTQHGVMVD